MTENAHPPAARTPAPRGPEARTALDVATQQLAAIERFHRSRHAAEAAAETSARTREDRMDLERQREVRRRQHEALIARSQAHLERSGQLVTRLAERRVVIAHRNDWLVDRVTALLAEARVQVVARVDNGADAIGTILAEQPDLVLVEDLLAMVPGEQVVREVRALSPDTLVAGHVGSNDQVARLLDAGAVAVYTRQSRPQEVGQGLVDLLVPQLAAVR